MPENRLAKQFHLGSLLRFACPTIVMMVIMSLYTMVDGAFVSRFAGTAALSAVNIVYPALSAVLAVGIMLATGGSAIIARKLGEGNVAQARQDFTFTVLVGAGAGLLLMALGLLFLDPMLHMLGAGSGELYALCRAYTLPLLFSTAPCMVAMLFQSLFVTAGRPIMGLVVTAIGGVANIVLDYIFIVLLNMGIAGAALGTGIGYSIPAAYGLLYFSLSRRGTLYFVRTRFAGRMLLQSCANGSSEMVTNLATAVTTFLFNQQMLRYVGEDGVAAVTIVLYTQFLLTAVYLGYSTGTAPVFSYNFGSGDTAQLKRLFRMSLAAILVASAATFALAMPLAGPIVSLFALPGNPVYDLGIYGFRLFAISFLFTGLSIFASSFFTALSDGRTSAVISLMRTFVFLMLLLWLLPLWLGVDGIWLAVPLAELLGAGVSIWYLCRMRKKYEYA